MIRLLRENWFSGHRLLLLWIFCLGMFGVAAVYSSQGGYSLEAITSLCFVYAFISGLYFADQGNSGNVDSQIICGCSRQQIYMADLLVLLLMCLMIFGSTLAGDLLGTALTGAGFRYSIPGYLLFLFGGILNTAAYISILTIIEMLLISRRSGRNVFALVVTLCIIAGIAIAGLIIRGELGEPETIWQLNADTKVSEVPSAIEDMDLVEVPNPHYVHEPLRSRYVIVTEILPFTQSILLLETIFQAPSPSALHSLYEMWLYSGLIAAGCTASGILLFKRRNLN